MKGVRSALAALLIPLVAFCVQLVLWPSLAPYAWLIFSLAVFLASWVGGLSSGLVATALSAAIVWWRFVPPEHALLKEPRYVVPLGTFIVTGMLFSEFHRRLRRANRDTAAALAASELANERLSQVSNERRILAALIDNSSDFIGVADASGKPVYLNPAGRRMVGLAPDYPVESTEILDYYPPEQREFASEVIIQTMLEQGHWHGENYLRHWQTEEAIPVSDTHFMIREPETDRLLGSATITRDISEARRASEQIARLYAQTKELDELKTQFFANVSHELRTPLTLILGLTERLLRAAETPDAARRDLDVVARNARTLVRGVNDLLDIAKLEAGRMKVEYAAVDLPRLVRLVGGHFDVLAVEKKIAFRVDAPDALRAEVDPEKVQRILFNLLSNAFKFTPDGGRVRLSARAAEGGRVVIEVGDSGPGIPPDKRDAIFERFRQLEGGATRLFGGTGLGLAIARELATLHDGTIDVTGAPEGGALFVVRLPQHAPAGSEVREPSSEAVLEEEPALAASELRGASVPASVPAPMADGALVLVVEDNAEMNRFICESLAPDHRVAAALDGRDGLQKTIDLEPDVVLTDVMMPGMSGDDLVHAIRAHRELDRTPIVILTAKADEQLRVRLLREGAQDYLTKPFSIDELRSRIDNLLAAKKALELEARLASLVELAPEGIFVADLEDRCIEVNSAGCRILGLAREEVIGRPLGNLVPPEYVEHLRRETRQLHEVGGVYVGEWTIRRKDGRDVPVEVSANILPDGRLQSFIRDVSDRRRIETELKLLAEMGSALASTLEYDETLSNIARLVVRDLADFCIVDAVEDREVRKLKVVSRDPSDAWVCDLFASVSLDRTRRYLVRQVLETQKPLLVERVSPGLVESWAQSEEHLRALRAARPESVIAVPLLAHGKLLGAMTLVSSTSSRLYGASDLHLVEELASGAALAIENARLYQAAGRAIEARDDVLGVVAHDLRNPLGTVLMQATLLRSCASDPDQRKPAEVIERAATRMNRLIQDLLDVTQMEAGGLSVTQGALPAVQIVSDAVEGQRPLASSSSVELALEVDHDLPDVWVDRDRLLQVFENLIGNAIKFGGAGSRVTVGATPRAHDVLFCVTDTGRGIAAEDLPHVFDRFWQARKGERQGAGLGLPIVKGIVEAHGGRAWVKSTPGRGTAFYFTIPTARPDQAMVQRPRLQPSSPHR